MVLCVCVVELDDLQVGASIANAKQTARQHVLDKEALSAPGLSYIYIIVIAGHRALPVKTLTEKCITTLLWWPTEEAQRRASCNASSVQQQQADRTTTYNTDPHMGDKAHIYISDYLLKGMKVIGILQLSCYVKEM